MAWIESHQTLAAHPKTRKLAHLLGVSKPTTIGHLHCLWWWAIDYTEDGNLERFDALDIAIAAEWDGDAETFVAALVKSGFLDVTHNETLAIHDWQDYAGKLIERKKANAKRMREARAAEKAADDAHDSGTNDERAAHVQRTDDARAERPNQTIPNHTQPNPTVGDKSPTPPAAPAKQSGYPADFESWWVAYPPGHGVKKAAYEHWKKIKPDAAMVQVLIDAVDGWQQSDRWKRGFVMDAQRWLRDRAWESVPPPQPANGALTVHNGGRRDVPGRDGRTDAERGYRLDPGPKGWSADELARMSMDLERSGT